MLWRQRWSSYYRPKRKKKKQNRKRNKERACKLCPDLSVSSSVVVALQSICQLSSDRKRKSTWENCCVGLNKGKRRIGVVERNIPKCSIPNILREYVDWPGWLLQCIKCDAYFSCTSLSDDSKSWTWVLLMFGKNVDTTTFLDFRYKDLSDKCCSVSPKVQISGRLELRLSQSPEAKKCR